MSLTITREQFEAAVKATGTGAAGVIAEAFAAAGITVAPPEPPEAMFKMAEEAFLAVHYKIDHCPSFTAGYIAALQHAAKVVREVHSMDYDLDGVLYVRAERILRQLGDIA